MCRLMGHRVPDKRCNQIKVRKFLPKYVQMSSTVIGFHLIYPLYGINLPAVFDVPSEILVCQNEKALNKQTRTLGNAIRMWQFKQVSCRHRNIGDACVLKWHQRHTQIQIYSMVVLFFRASLLDPRKIVCYRWCWRASQNGSNVLAWIVSRCNAHRIVCVGIIASEYSNSTELFTSYFFYC